MANRFPLIIDSATNRIVELPATDNLDLAGSNISSVANITAGNSVTASYFVGTLYGVANSAVVADSANGVAGANVTGAVAYATTANSVAGANVSGAVSSATTATTATTAGTVTTNAQPNITSVGSLTGLTVSNASGVVNFITTSNVSLGAVGNVKITGGSANQYLQTDGAGNVTFATLNADSYQLQSVTAATTTNIGLNGTQTVDGISITAGLRVLVKNQTVTADNGIYVSSAGSWTRSTDFTTGAATLLGGVTVGVISGTSNAGTQWICSNTTAISVGATPITFVRNNVNRIISVNPTTTAPAFTDQGGGYANSVAAGDGANAQFGQCTAFGAYANAGSYGTALGYGAKAINLGSIAIGILANATDGTRSIVIGENSTSTQALTVGLGYGTTSAGANSVAIGTNARSGALGSIGIGVGANANGQYTIAIGANAGYTSQASNTIILNATGSNLNMTTANTFTVKPVRSVATTVPSGFSPMYYNPTTGEIIVVV